jgi:hypothetical protein
MVLFVSTVYRNSVLRIQKIQNIVENRIKRKNS